MKKATRILAAILALLCITSCGTANVPVEETERTVIETEAVTETETEAKTEPVVIVVEEDVNADKLGIKSIEGLNEQIYVKIKKPTSMLTDFSKMDFKVSYRAMDEAEFTELDKELYLDEGAYVGCYILGLPKGQYCVKVERGEGENYARTTVLDIDVEKQDRSGYAHFNREEGIGGYNNDGSVKDNAVILYVNNANKNTVTLDIAGTTYTGLVSILKAKQYMEEPLIIRITDRITTNQWMEKEFPVRYADDSNYDPTAFENTFETSAGENLAGLLLLLVDGREGKCYRYITTPDGVYLSSIVDAPAGTTTKDGIEVYDDYDWQNEIGIYNCSNLTIEGVGTKAECYQFGFSFSEENSIEIKNLTFDHYPNSALVFSSAEYTPQKYGNIWVHNNTFNSGYKNFCLDTNQDQKYGDGSCDLHQVDNVTIAYNKFNDCKKNMLIGSNDNDPNMNITLHHNLYLLCLNRLPVCGHANLHSYNNVYLNCGVSVLVRSPHGNFFSESNWYFSYNEFRNCYPNIKSYNDWYDEWDDGFRTAATIVTDREQAIENDCSPDGVTDYSKFDTDPTLFYYDTENKCSDVEFMLSTADMDLYAAWDWAEIYTGAGRNVKLDLSGDGE